MKEHPKGGRGWSNNRCPDCSRAAENQRYHQQIKQDADKMESRRRQGREYQRKKANGGVDAPPMDTGAPETPVIERTDAIAGRDSEEAERKATAERVRAALAKKGIAPLTGRVKVNRN